jgi:phosphopantetheine adenylyltransferase
VKTSDRGCVATIGNFDGVHLGHTQVITAVKQRAEALGLPSLAITFEPTPIEYFAPDKAPARLTRLAEKLHLLEAQQIDRTLILRFNQFLATQPAEEFVKQILVEQLGVKASLCREMTSALVISAKVTLRCCSRWVKSLALRWKTCRRLRSTLKGSAVRVFVVRCWPVILSKQKSAWVVITALQVEWGMEISVVDRLASLP